MSLETFRVECFLLPRTAWADTSPLSWPVLAIFSRLQRILLFLTSFLFSLLHSVELYSSKKAYTKSNRDPVFPLNLGVPKGSTYSRPETALILMLLLSCSCRGRESRRGSRLLAEMARPFQRFRRSLVEQNSSLAQGSSPRRHPQPSQAGTKPANATGTGSSQVAFG